MSIQGYSTTGKPPARSDFDAFRDSYRGLWEGVLEQAHRVAAVADHAVLLQLSLLKILLASPGMVIGELRRQLHKDADMPYRDNQGRSLELHERLVSIAKHESGIRYRTLRRLFKLVQQLEAKELRKIRKSILGISWMLPKTLLFNPLLHLHDLSRETYFSNHYPIVCMDRTDEGYFVLTNRIFCEQFDDYIPDWSRPFISDSSKMDAGRRFSGASARVEWRFCRFFGWSSDAGTSHAGSRVRRVSLFLVGRSEKYRSDIAKIKQKFLVYRFQQQREAGGGFEKQ